MRTNRHTPRTPRSGNPHNGRNDSCQESLLPVSPRCQPLGFGMSFCCQCSYPWPAYRRCTACFMRVLSRPVGPAGDPRRGRPRGGRAQFIPNGELSREPDEPAEPGRALLDAGVGQVRVSIILHDLPVTGREWFGRLRNACVRGSGRGNRRCRRGPCEESHRHFLLFWVRTNPR